MPNLFALIAISCWPLVSIILFKKLDIERAVILTVISGYLLLPVRVSIDFPLIPPINKGSIISLSLLIGCLIIKKFPLKIIPTHGAERTLILILLTIPLISTVTNSEAFYNGEYWIQGLSYHDAISEIISKYLSLIPLIVSLQVLKTETAQRKLFLILSLSGLMYSLPILFEIRMSPQLHTWFYGFFPHTFAQTYRDGGFRAVVFLGHGLLVAMFIATSLGSASTLWKAKIKIWGIPAIYPTLFLLLILLLSKTLGALILGSILLITTIWFSSKARMYIASAFMSIVILYPILSILSIFPHKELIDLIATFNPQRADSLSFRFYHEAILLDHAYEKIIFGWGGWGRNRFYDSVTDGFWIITLGISGIVGFIATFGLGFVSIFRSIKSLKLCTSEQTHLFMSVHMLIVSIVMIDQIPNASFNSLSMLLIGTLLGRCTFIQQHYK